MSDDATQVSDALTPTAPPTPRRSLLGWCVRALLSLVAAILILGMLGWCVLAIHFSNLPGAQLRTAAAALFGVAWMATFMFKRRRGRTALWFLGAFAAIVAWWSFMPASNDRTWLPEYAKMPHAEIDGDLVTVHNIRNFDYRSETDFDAAYHDKTFDLRDIESVDFVGSHWGIKNVIHTMLTFGFRGGEHVALSVETRREVDEPQTALRSLFKQYELIYILADECDLLRLRSNFRKENLYVFPTTTTREQARTLFLATIAQINDLHQRPRFYNLLTDNCTTGLVPLVQSIHPIKRFDWRYLLNAYSVLHAYDDGWIDNSLSPQDALKRYHVNQYVEGHPECAGYSQRIRPQGVGD